jgi:hypothetical protein
MVREPNIPLFLWIATAILVHLTWGGGADRVSEAVQEQMDVRRFARAVSTQVRRAHTTIEISFEGDEPDEPEPPSQSATPAPVDEPLKGAAVEPDPDKPEATEQSKPKAEEPPKVELPKPVELPTEQPKANEAHKVQNRIAVQQLVEDPNQAPNPNAALIGEHDNHAKEETQARITSTEQNDANPSPGGAYTGPTPDPGDSHVTEIAQLEDRQGNPERAPGEPTHGEADLSQAREAARAGSKAAADRTPGSPQDAEREIAQARAEHQERSQPGQPGRTAQEAIAESPALHDSADGQFRVAERAPAQTDQRGQTKQRYKLPPLRKKTPNTLLGLGSLGTTPNGINLNLSPSDAVAIVGADQLAKNVAADGERRRSKHRGSWRTSGLERWRSAIENYVPHVKPGNTTALNTARVPFAVYLNKIHQRIHPIFADQFLASLDSMPGDNPLNRMDMHTNVEIVLSRADGSVVDLGVTKASGVTAFDIGALDSVFRAAPYGTPPSAIVSPDGNVYLHWEFWRDPNYACSTYFAHPKMLKADPKSVPFDPTLPPLRPEEEPVPQQGRQGFWLPASPAPQWRGPFAPNRLATVPRLLHR